MRQPSQRGAIFIEFTLFTLVMVTILLGVVGLGLAMQNQLQTVQLARDAGHMYARGINFTQTGNQQILVGIAGSLGLSTTLGSGNASVILSEVRYVDQSACQQAGLVDSSGNPSGCSNYQTWVFAERIVVGNNSSSYYSRLGTPPSSMIASDGTISINYQAGASGNTSDQVGSAWASMGFNPWNATTDTGVPSGQWVYVAEAQALGFAMPPFSSGGMTYAMLCF